MKKEFEDWFYAKRSEDVSMLNRFGEQRAAYNVGKDYDNNKDVMFAAWKAARKSIKKIKIDNTKDIVITEDMVGDTDE